MYKYIDDPLRVTPKQWKIRKIQTYKIESSPNIVNNLFFASKLKRKPF